MHPAWSRCLPLPISPDTMTAGRLFRMIRFLRMGWCSLSGSRSLPWSQSLLSPRAKRRGWHKSNMKSCPRCSMWPAAGSRSLMSYRRCSCAEAMPSAQWNLRHGVFRVKFRSVGRNSFTLKGRYPMSHRKKMAAFTCGVRPSIRAKCSRWSRMRSASISTRWWSRCVAWAGALVARSRSRRSSPVSPQLQPAS